MLNNIEDQFDLNTRKANVSIRPFPGATTEHMKDYITPIARKQPNILIIHTGTKNVRDGKPKDIVDKLLNCNAMQNQYPLIQTLFFQML